MVSTTPHSPSETWGAQTFGRGGVWGVCHSHHHVPSKIFYSRQLSLKTPIQYVDFKTWSEYWTTARHKIQWDTYTILYTGYRLRPFFLLLFFPVVAPESPHFLQIIDVCLQFFIDKSYEILVLISQIYDGYGTTKEVLYKHEGSEEKKVGNRYSWRNEKVN